MKKVLAIKYVLLYLLLCTFFSCIDKNIKSKKIELIKNSDTRIISANTELKIENNIFNIGVLPKSDSIIVINNTIKNIGKTSLFISELKSSCGCAKTTISNKVVKPRDTAIIELNIHLKGKGGSIGLRTEFKANTKEKYHSFFTKMIIK